MLARFLASVLVSCVLAQAPLLHAQSLSMSTNEDGTFSEAADALPIEPALRWPGVTRYDPDIPTPSEVIGHRIGTRHTIPSQVVRYFEAVAAASPRVTVRQHGLTHEGRALIHAIVTTPERQADLDGLRAAHVRGVLGGVLQTSGLQDQAPDAPAVAYMGYSVHGNEASGTEAAILTLYHLAAGDGPAVDSVLNGVVTIVDPMFNPDGRDRFADWANRNRGAVATADPQDREHNEPWPNGRTNHYWFDLNRDWLPAVHPESQARLRMFYDWRPQVLTDFHEMGSEATYFFQPGIPSRTNPLTPPANQVLTGRITDYVAAGLDRIGSLYYTRESYDDFYYGKGSTYPDVNGSVGILFEQASSRALDRDVEAGNLSYGFTVRNQLTASLATLEGIAAIGDDLLAHSRDFYAGSGAFAKTLPTQAYVLPLGDQAQRVTELANLLRRHDVQVHPITGQVSGDGERFGPGEALVIPTGQTQARFLNAVMEPNTEFVDSLFYDVSTWDLPLAYDVEVHRLRSVPSDQLGAPLDTVALAPGRIIGARAGQTPYAYVLPWRDYNAARASYGFSAAGIQGRVMHQPFRITSEGQQIKLPRGSVVVPLSQNPVGADSVRRAAQRLAAELGVDLYAVTTGLTPTGPDLGGRSTTLLREPTVAIVTGRGVNAYQAGTVWHLLSERVGIPVSLVDQDRTSDIDLGRYTHIAMTGGRYNDLDVEALEAWVRAGGTLLASDDAAGWAVQHELLKLEEDELDVDSLVRDRPYAELSDARGAQVIGGAIMRVELDTTHPLAYGLDGELALFRQGTQFYEPSEVPGANVGVYADDPLAAGYLSRERRRQAGGKAAVVCQDVGKGRVIAMFDQPVFRGFFRGSERLWLNGVIGTW